MSRIRITTPWSFGLLKNCCHATIPCGREKLDSWRIVKLDVLQRLLGAWRAVHDMQRAIDQASFHAVMVSYSAFGRSPSDGLNLLEAKTGNLAAVVNKDGICLVPATTFTLQRMAGLYAVVAPYFVEDLVHLDLFLILGWCESKSIATPLRNELVPLFLA